MGSSLVERSSHKLLMETWLAFRLRSLESFRFCVLSYSGNELAIFCRREKGESGFCTLGLAYHLHIDHGIAKADPESLELGSCGLQNFVSVSFHSPSKRLFLLERDSREASPRTSFAR